MMKRKLFVLLFLIFLIMGGCKSEEQLPDEEIVFEDFSFTLGKDGILYCSDLLYITDYATGVTVPLCNKPNCDHNENNPQCNAVFPGMVSTAFIYHNKLYVFSWDGLNHSTVYMAENTGEGRQKIAEADFVMWGGYSTFFRNGKLYFKAERESYQEDNSLQREIEYFIGSFDTDDQHFEILTTPTTPDMRGVNLCGVTNEEFFFTRYTYKGAKEDWTNVSVEYIAKNLETGEERNFLEPDDDHELFDYYVVESGTYYVLGKDGIYEYWKRETDGDEIFFYSSDHLAPYRPIINGEPSFEKDKSDFQKEMFGSCTCGDIIFLRDSRNGGRHGIMTIDNYLNDIDEIVYPEFPNMRYSSGYEIVEP